MELLLDKPVGVAEHPDIMETIELELGKMAEYDDKLSMLKQFDKNKYVGKSSRFSVQVWWVEKRVLDCR